MRQPFLYRSALLARRAGALIAMLVVLVVFPPAAAPAVLAQESDSLFGFPIYLPKTLPTTRDFAIGDLDLDGGLDIVVGYADFAPHVYLNNRNGAFSEPRALPLFPGTSRIALGDLNGDGKLDIVHGISTPQTGPPFPGLTQVALGNGDGTFGNPFILRESMGWANDIALGDLNGDRVLDIIEVGDYFNTGGSSRVYLGVGDGTFVSAPALPGSDEAARRVALGDLNGDGILDSAVNFSSGNRFGTQIYLGSGDGTFVTGANVATGLAALGDLNGDSRLDLVVSNGVCLGKGDGTFGPPISLPDDSWIGGATLGDVDGDGALDLVMSNGIYLGKGNGSFNPSISLLDNGGFGSAALADLNGDGMLDLTVQGDFSGFIQVYLANPRVGLMRPSDLPGSLSGQGIAALGDLNGDGALDIVADNHTYLGQGNGSFTETAELDTSQFGVALGDFNGDAKLDAVTHAGTIYLGQGDGRFAFLTSLPLPPLPAPSPESKPRRVALGDFNGDGALDIVRAYGLDFTLTSSPAHASQIYLGQGNGAFAAPIDLPGSEGNALDVALGDLNGDGVLDIVDTHAPLNSPVGGLPIDQGSRVYLGKGDGMFDPPVRLASSRLASSLALGDLNGDGALDIVLGSAPLQVYINRKDGTFDQPADLLGSGKSTSRVAVGDLNGDGVLDLAEGNNVYLGKGDGSFTLPVNLPGDDRDTSSVAVGDLNRDGQLDLLLTNGTFPAQVFLSAAAVSSGLPNNPPRVTVARPGPTPNANFFSTPAILASQIIPIRYTLFDPESDAVGAVRAFFSLDGGGSWRPAIAATGTITKNLAASPAGIEHIFSWDTFASGVFGQSDNVVFRIEAYGVGSGNSGYNAGPYQRPFVSATTFPFRVRGSQVRVVRDGDAQPDARIYRLNDGQPLGGGLIANASGTAFTTDPQGYLRGRGEIRPGDRLLALAPISSTTSYTLYATNGAPTPTSTDAFTVTASGVQTLEVSLDHPLILFDINVSLEWDASSSPSYVQQLEFNLQRASQYLYDFTNGQVALGRVTVHQNADDWAFSDVVIHATNRLRPFAAQGGVVLTPTVDPQFPDTVYDTGQVHIGATWSRYGTPGQTLGDDWSIILAHELSHYLLYQDDSYLGLNQDGFLIAVRGCTGSAMGDLYTNPDATEFIADRAHWDAACADTLANQTLRRTEWQTIDTWYPALHPPTEVNPGPGIMPFDFTSVNIAAPITPTQALADPTFYLDYSGGQTRSSEARAFLERDGKYILDVGSPFGGQNRLLARGAQPGDRLCVFDRQRQQFGCEMVALGDDRLAMRRDTSWAPVIRLTPVTSRTFELGADGLPAGLALKARLFPEFGPGSAPIELARLGSVYTGTFLLDEPALAGNVQVWVDEPATEEQPRRETIVAYTVGGDPGFSRGGGGFSRGGGGFSRGGGGFSRGGGGFSRGGGAPLLSPDGQMIFFTPNPIIFQEGQFYTIQSMGALPPLPIGKTVIGQGYSLVATAGTPVITGSISFQYLESDVLVAGVSENQLTVHFWDGQTWRALPTLRDSYVNLASAPSQGSGFYALMAGVSTPRIESISPAASTNDMTTTLTIAGSDFLPPVSASLVGADRTYSLPVTSAFSSTVTAVITAGLAAGEYQVVVTNGDGGQSAPAPLALYSPSSARFYDFFESGAGKWQLDGEWGIVALPDGGHATTDSPDGNYNSAIPPAATRTTHITSQPFSLDGLASPVLSFRHDYVLARLGSSQDVARVEISTDNGATWTTLASYSGGGIYGAGARVQDAQALEWTNINWKQVSIDLSGYSGTARLRFSLEVDQTVSDKGWVIDDVMVQSF